jgi:hypothetical protein
MWQLFAAIAAAVLPELIKLWGQPSEEDWVAMRAAVKPLTSPDQIDAELADDASGKPPA